jgi:hypothetical protein
MQFAQACCTAGFETRFLTDLAVVTWQARRLIQLASNHIGYDKKTIPGH